MKHCPQCQQTYSDTQRFCLNDGELLSLRDPYHLLGRALNDKYRLDALIGIGGMGAVYSAYHLGIDRHIAIKILQPNVAIGNSQIISLFEREAKIAGRLFHENIVNIFDAGRTADDIAYIAMEWLDGCTLQDELAAQGPLGFERVAEILRQVADALEEAHARHVIHRDLKPSNVMLIKRRDGRERIKVLDFGISKVLSATAGSPVSSMMGTPHYASPEQFQVGVNIDGRADIYSLGVMLYEMLTGAIPFNATSLHELIRLQMTAAPRPLRQLRPDAPAAVEQLLARLLAKEPDQRPQLVNEIPMLFNQALSSSSQPQVETLIVGDPPSASEQPLEKKNELLAQPTLLTLPREAEVETAKAIPLTLLNPHSSSPALNEAGSLMLIPQTARSFRAIGIAIGAVVLIIALIAHWVWKPAPTETEQSAATAKRSVAQSSTAPASSTRIEVLRYYLELEPFGTGPFRITGLDPLAADQRFKFHFSPQAGGYFYIVSERADKVMKTLLTAQPAPASGVNTNLVMAGSDFLFPRGDNWIKLQSGDTTLFTIIFSPSRIDKPSFLAAPAGRSLTVAEQQELKAFREQFKANAEVTSKSNGDQPTVLVSVPAERGETEVLIFDISIKQQ